MDVIRYSVTSPKVKGLIRSLEEATLVRVKWNGRESRTGSTYYLRKVEATLETGKHTHELVCYATAPHRLTCSWLVDGEEVGLIETGVGDRLYETIVGAVDYALRMEKESDNEVKLKKWPFLALE